MSESEGGAGKPLRIHVLYEHGRDLRPHGTSYLRLLRPLTHPTVRAAVAVSAGRSYEGQPVDAVVVDRLWRPDVTRALAEGLVETVRRSGARLLYTLDDNFPDLARERSDGPSPEHLAVVELFLRAADTVVVTTEALRARVAAHAAGRTVVLPNTLDERLLVGGALAWRRAPRESGRIVVGCMGTRTHDSDVMMLLPALRRVLHRHEGNVKLEFVGVAGDAATVAALRDIPARIVSPRAEEVAYPLFMLWFTSRVDWDLALAPLRATPFTQCKSDVKFLDYAAIGAAPLLSRHVAYAGTVRHGETGWLVDEDPAAWEEAIEHLIGDACARQSIARAATEYLYRERVLARCGRRWTAALA